MDHAVPESFSILTLHPDPLVRAGVAASLRRHTAFEVLEAPFAAGHGFPNDAGQQGGSRLVVLSYDFWVRQFGARASIVDSVLTLGGDPYRVTGVLDKDVVFPMAADVYAPFMPRASEASTYGGRSYTVFARLTPGATMATAAAETRTIGVRLQVSDDPALLAPFFDQIHLIELQFPKYTDGRAFSQSQLLRRRFGYKGEIRAVGQVLRDQLRLMIRPGRGSRLSLHVRNGRTNTP